MVSPGCSFAVLGLTGFVAGGAALDCKANCAMRGKPMAQAIGQHAHILGLLKRCVVNTFYNED
jgi:hypothetical protein